MATLNCLNISSPKSRFQMEESKLEKVTIPAYHLIDDHSIDDHPIAIYDSMVAENDNDLKDQHSDIMEVIDVTQSKPIQALVDEFSVLLHNKSPSDLHTECTNEKCNGVNHIFDVLNQQQMDSDDNDKSVMIHQIECGPLLRIRIILHLHSQLLKSPVALNKISMSSKMKSDWYGHQQLLDDFQHIQIVHCQSLTRSQILCQWMQSELPCDSRCPSWRRHIRVRNAENEMDQFYRPSNDEESHTKCTEIINEKDIVFQQELDKIHTFFIHPFDEKGRDIRGRTVHKGRRRSISESSRTESYQGPHAISNGYSTPQPTTPLFVNRRSVGSTFRRGQEWTPRGGQSISEDHEWTPRGQISIGVINEPPRISSAQHSDISTDDEMGSDDTDHMVAHKPSLSMMMYSDYIGQPEDILWLNRSLGSKIKLLDPRTSDEVLLQNEGEVYRRLVEGMGNFVWQSAQYVGGVCVYMYSVYSVDRNQ